MLMSERIERVYVQKWCVYEEGRCVRGRYYLLILTPPLPKVADDTPVSLSLYSSKKGIIVGNLYLLFCFPRYRLVA